MADIYGSHFSYGGVNSREYNLMIANIDSPRNVDLSGKISGVFVSNHSQRYLVDNDFANFPVSYDIEFVKDDDCPLSFAEQRRLEKWLFNRSKFRKLYIDEEDDTLNQFSELIDGEEKRLYMNCRFINARRIENDGSVVGYYATLEADSGLWWQDAIQKSFVLDATPSNISVFVDSDYDGYIYPKVWINTGNSGGDVILSNATDSVTRLTKFVGLPANRTLMVDSDVNVVALMTGSDQPTNAAYDRFYYRNFPRLLDGRNIIHIEGDVTSVIFEYSNRRFL